MALGSVSTANAASLFFDETNPAAPNQLLVSWSVFDVADGDANGPGDVDGSNQSATNNAPGESFALDQNVSFTGSFNNGDVNIAGVATQTVYFVESAGSSVVTDIFKIQTNSLNGTTAVTASFSPGTSTLPGGTPAGDIFVAGVDVFNFDGFAGTPNLTGAVAVLAAPSSVVPLPAGGVLLLTGLAGLAVLRRRSS
ncbi:MAG: VPLPA-CTERM sorting domain-containing protein [Pikeienuella sp.]